MDIVLEVFDTFLFDRLWSFVLPGTAKPSMHSDNGNVLSRNLGTATFSSQREQPTLHYYNPSTQYFQLEPSQYAYMSAWPRDNVYRQGISLYLITWYVWGRIHQSGSSEIPERAYFADSVEIFGTGSAIAKFS